MAVPRAYLWGAIILTTAIIMAKVFESDSKSFTRSFVIKDVPPEEVFRYFVNQKNFVKLLPVKLTISNLVKSKNENGMDQISYLASTDPTLLFGFYKTNFTLPITATVIYNSTAPAQGKSININIYVRGVMTLDENWSFAENPVGGTVVTDFTTITSYNYAAELVRSEIENVHVGFLYEKVKAVFEKGQYKQGYY